MFLKFWKWFQPFQGKTLVSFLFLIFYRQKEKLKKKSTPEQPFVGDYLTEIIEFDGRNTLMESKVKTPPDPVENVLSS